MLSRGDTAIDVACGSGLNFALLQEHVGSGGRIIGVDVSPEMLSNAARRALEHGWRNVTLIEAAVQDAALPEPADAALFSLTHDVLQSPAAVANVLAHLHPGARVASFGSKWAPRWALPVNVVVRAIAARYVTTFSGFDRPWAVLQQQLPGLQVEPVALGGAYIAWGPVRDLTT